MRCRRRVITALLGLALSAGLSAWAGPEPPAATEGIQAALKALADDDPRAAERIAARLAVSGAAGAQRAWLIAGTARQRLGSYADAAQAYRRFLACCDDADERRYVLERIEECTSAAGDAPRPRPASQLLSRRQLARLATVEGRHRRQIETTEHFAVRAYNDELARLTGRRAEVALAHICRVILRGQEFPHSVDIYVWPTISEFRKHATSAPEWAGGSFSITRGPDGAARRRIDLTQLDDEQRFDTAMLDRVLPHEICHLVVAEYFGDRPCPLAINEGLAMMAEATVDNARVRLAGAVLAGEKKIPLGRLLTLTAVDGEQAHVFYAEAFSLTSYLHHGMTARQFRELLAQIKGGCAFEDAVQRALGLPHEDGFLGRLASAWEDEAIRQGQFLRALDTEVSAAR